jgi:hypothetical protein
VQFFIPHLARWLRTRRFSERIFRPAGAYFSATVNCDFSIFRAPASSFFWLFPLIFSLLLFSPLTLPTSAFQSVHIVGRLTSKLPSINHTVFLQTSKHRGRISHQDPPVTPMSLQATGWKVSRGDIRRDVSARECLMRAV